MRRITSSPAIPSSRPTASKGSRSSGTSRWMRLSISLSVLSIMRLPVVVLTTLYEPFSTILLLYERTISGETETRYENVYVVSCSRRDAAPNSPLRTARLHRLLVLGVHVPDVPPDQALRVRQVVAALAKHVGGMEGRHRLYAVYLVPLAAVFRYAEILVDDRLRGGASEAEDDLGLDSFDLALQVGIAGPDLARLRLAVLHPAALFDGGAALDDVGQVDLLSGQIHGRQDVVEQLTGPPDEGQPRGVLVLAGPLADEHQGRVGVPCREDRVGAGLRQVALGAHGDLAGELFQTFLAVLAAFCGIEKTLQGSSRSASVPAGYSTPRAPNSRGHLLQADRWPTMPAVLQCEGRAKVIILDRNHAEWP